MLASCPNRKKHLLEVQENHSLQIREVLKKSDRVELLKVSFPDLIANPEPTFNELAAFLGQQLCPGPKVEACIKPALHRNRKSSPAWGRVRGPDGENPRQIHIFSALIDGLVI